MTVQQIEQELSNTNAENIQSISLLMEKGAKIASWISYTGQQLSVAKRDLLIAKKQAYKSVMAQLQEQGKDPSPSLVKDYVGTLCADQEAYYLLCDRVNAAATHTLTFINVCLSCLKEEMKAINYNQ